MAAKILPDADLLRQLLEYDPKTGLFTHKSRSLEMFKSKRDWKAWNTLYAHKPASSNYSKGYKAICVNGEKFFAHRVAYKIHYGLEPPEVLDHINGDGNDNRITNLREATQSQNIMNCKRRADNSSGYRGVAFDKRVRRFVAHIHHNGKQIRIGSFATASEAADAYRAKAMILHGEFSGLLRPPDNL